MAATPASSFKLVDNVIPGMQSSCPGLNKRTSVVLSKSNYPYVTQSSDLIHHDHLFTKVKFPDVDPSLLNDIEFNEDSFESYCFNCKKEFDVVATLYFIDTAYNIVDYIKSIRKVLKKGGLWINLGPLHWSNNRRDSFHFSIDEILEICLDHGFTLLQKEFIDDTLYIPHSNTTCPLTYKNLFFILKKDE